MRVVVSNFISLDGVVQSPGGAEEDTEGGFAHGGWSMPYFDPQTMGPVMNHGMEQTEALLFGRRTWQTMAAAWPGRAGDPFADRFNAVPKYVASRTLAQDDLSWNNSRLLEGDAVAAVAALREQPGGWLQILGSTVLVQSLISADLVDDYYLLVEPIVLGGGKKLFPADGTARPLRLESVSTASTGVQIVHYETVR